MKTLEKWSEDNFFSDEAKKGDELKDEKQRKAEDVAVGFNQRTTFVGREILFSEKNIMLRFLANSFFWDLDDQAFLKFAQLQS